jgi:hypothetical protein
MRPCDIWGSPAVRLADLLDVTLCALQLGANISDETAARRSHKNNNIF